MRWMSLKLAPFQRGKITDCDNHEIHVSFHRRVNGVFNRIQIRRVSLNKSDVLLPLERFNRLRRRSCEYEKSVLFRLRSKKLEDMIPDVLRRTETKNSFC